MNRTLVAAALACISFSAYADEWTGRDKNLHFAGGAAIATAVTATTGNEWHGFLAGTAAGLAKEIHDATGRGQLSGKDFAVTALGAFAGAKITGLALGKNRVTYTINMNIF